MIILFHYIMYAIKNFNLKYKYFNIYNFRSLYIINSSIFNDILMYHPQNTIQPIGYISDI